MNLDHAPWHHESVHELLQDTHANGHNKILWWIICAFTVFMGGLVSTSLTMVISQGARISSLEAHFEENRAQLQRIENKVESLLGFERRRDHP